MAIIGSDIFVASALLQKNELVGIPTETVYGLAGNAFSTTAITRIFEVKNRPFFDPLIVHIGNLNQLDPIVNGVPSIANKLMDAFWPGPLTLLLPKSNRIPDLVTAGSQFVAVRMPNHQLCLQLLNQLPFPLAAPSANPFGYISPTTAYHVNQQLGDKISYILDGGPSEVGLESTIVQLNKDSVVVLRLGGLSLERLELVLGKPVDEVRLSASNPNAPGMLVSHYAPRTPFTIKPPNISWENHLASFKKNIGILAFTDLPIEIKNSNNYQILSHSADINEAACALFAAMRQLDALNLDLIVGEYLPEVGLGRAINDRLSRAAK